MDLRSIINNEAGESSSSRQAAPITPIQTGPPRKALREYSHPPQASPGKHLSQDYGAASQPGGHYASPSSYQSSYAGRPPPPPPIQAPAQHDLRSPAGSYSAQSPFRQTPTSSMSGGYPFPPGHQTTPQSPAQHHQYPPAYQRDNYSQSNPSPQLQQHNSQTQASPPPQTPPIGMPGQPHPYLQHSRSQSSLSASTPTSAQSQPPYHNQFPHESPSTTTQFPPSHLPQNQRQQSQPGTPLGPPISQRHSSGGFAQPTSPYQQRGASSGPFANYQQTSPAPPPPALIPRLPSTPSTYDSQRTSLGEQQRRSQSERERSLSVSPKTRLPSQPPTNVPQQQQQQASPYNSSVKRKMDDRDKPTEEPRRIKQEDVKPQINGEHHHSQSLTSSPQQPARKRIRYTEPPIWAQSVRIKGLFASAATRAVPKVNGKQTASPNHPQVSRSPLVTNGHQSTPAAVNRPGPSDVAKDDPSLILGPWERTIINKKPVDAITKAVADWVLELVVNRSDFGELSSRGVQVEIEAKLGQLVDKDTGVRYYLPIVTEAIVKEQARTSFRSSMTEAQHMSMNNFLNSKVKETHPNNHERIEKRVPIEYLHRRETDKFYELPASHLSTLPPAIQEALANLGSRHTVKVRVSTDQKTGQLLGKIIKARVADLNIYNPQSPMDCRISINLEMPYEGDLEELKAIATDTRIADRNKDRLSYTQSHYQIDLTQVTQLVSVSGSNRTEKEHELEIELSTAAVREQGLRAMAGEQHEYLALIEGLVDNVRLLARTVPPTPR